MASRTELRTNENTLLRPEFKKLNDLLISDIKDFSKECKMNNEWCEELIRTMKMQVAKGQAKHKVPVLQNKSVRRKKTCEQKQGILSTTNLFEDSTTMNMSTRSRRAAARNASEKMKQGNIPMNRKLRRPTNFDEFSKAQKRLQIDAFQPPSKYTRTRNNQSAGSSTLSTKDFPNDERKESVSSKVEADSTTSPTQLPKEKLDPYVVLTRCNEGKPELKSNTFGNVPVQINIDNISESAVSKNKDSLVIEGKNNFKNNADCPLSSEVDCAVKRLNETYKANVQEKDLSFKCPTVCDSNTNNCIVNEQVSEVPSVDECRTRGRFTRKKANETSDILDSQVTVSEIIENPRTRTKIIKKKCEDLNIVENADAESEIKDTEIIENSRTRTKIIKKKCEDLNIVENADAESEIKDTEIIENSRTRTKIIKKKCEHINNVENADVESEIKETVDNKTRTKVIRKKQENLDNVANDDSKHEVKEKEGELKTRTKIIKSKQEECITNIDNMDSGSEIKEVTVSLTKLIVLKKDQNNVDTNSEIKVMCEQGMRTNVKEKQEDIIDVVSADNTVKNRLEATRNKNENGLGRNVVTEISDTEDCCVDTMKKMENAKTESHQISEKKSKNSDSLAEGMHNKNVNENEHLDQLYTKTNIRNHDCQTSRIVKKNVDLQQSPKPNKGKIVDDKGLMSPNDLVKKRIEEYEKLQEESKKHDECGRVTRTKTRAMAKEDVNAKEENTDNKQTSDLEKTHAKIKVIQKKRKGKENVDAIAYSKIIEVHSTLMNGEKYKATPLSNCNRMGTPSSDSAKKFIFTESRVEMVQKGAGIILRPGDDVQQKKKEEILKRLRKADQARKNKEITLKATSEETRRKREERLQKAAAAREENARLKAAQAAQAEKEREEKLRALAVEKEKQKEEQVKKKLAAQLKAQEIEERRKQEEAARLAKIREQEEEHKRLEAIRQRVLDVAEQQKHLAEEQRAQEAEKNKEKAKHIKPALKQKQQQQQVGKTNAKVEKAGNNTYHMTPARNERPLMKPKNENDYGLDHAVSDDEETEDEDNPKKLIPLWARAENRAQPLHVQSYLPFEEWDVFMTCEATVDLSELFGSQKLQRMRTSSQYWGTPPT